MFSGFLVVFLGFPAGFLTLPPILESVFLWLCFCRQKPPCITDTVFLYDIFREPHRRVGALVVIRCESYACRDSAIEGFATVDILHVKLWKPMMSK